ncbi:MAG: asparagine synthetase B, partial [Bacteroidia bacterium]|nr:asparagine synthetase B [Bacteroidia bacterium]
MKKFLLTLMLLLSVTITNAAYMLIPMDEAQLNHLKAYGLIYWTIEQQVEV